MLQSPISHPAHPGRGADQSEAVAEPLFCRRAACHDTGRLTTASGSRGQARRLEELGSKRRALIPSANQWAVRPDFDPARWAIFCTGRSCFLGPCPMCRALLGLVARTQSHTWTAGTVGLVGGMNPRRLR